MCRVGASSEPPVLVLKEADVQIGHRRLKSEEEDGAGPEDLMVVSQLLRGCVTCLRRRENIIKVRSKKKGGKKEFDL